MTKIILKKKKVNGEYMIADFKTERPLTILPGQFLMLKNRTEPLLPKPFSVIESSKDSFKMLIRIVGRFTNYLKEAKAGEEFFCRGPYGNPFIDMIPKEKKVILIGGGCGGAPVIHFSKVYKNRARKLILGFKTKAINKILKDYDIIVEEETGETVVDHLRKYLDGLKPEKKEQLTIISCGSLQMHKAIVEKVDFAGEIFLSLDERMGCGIGMCKGCPVKTRDGIKMVCRDGTLFNSKELLLEW